MGFELVYLHSATADVIINSQMHYRYATQLVPFCSIQFSCLSGRRADRSKQRLWFGVFSRIKKVLGRIETRTRERMYLGRIRSIRDISWGDRARIATCSLRTPADLKQIWVFSAYKKILGRTETRTRERVYLGRIRSVRDISRGDRARIATCSARTTTDLMQIIV